MEGLEISEVRFKSIDLGDRYDSEYFFKNSLCIEKALLSLKGKKFSEYADFVASAFYPAATHLYEIGDTPFIRCVDCVNFPFITRGQDGIFERIPMEFAKNEGGVNLLERGDIVITKVGTPSFASMVKEHDVVALSRTVLGVKKIRTIDPYYLLIFLRSKYGFEQLQRQRELTIQYQLTLHRVKNILIYEASKRFQLLIRNISEAYEQKLSLSKTGYQEAESLLLSEIGFDGFVPSADNINTKAYSESFLSSGRLDSEYYLPKYEQVVGHIRKGKFNVLSHLVTIKKSIEPGSSAYADEGLPFIRVSDYDKFGITTPDKYLSDAYYKENADTLNKLKPKKETILFSKDGSVGIAHMLTEDLNGVTSGAILHLHVKDKQEVLPEYLTLVLNSQLVQMQAERDAGGSIILHWRVGEIENVVVPIISMDKQKEIKDMINQSFDAKAKSESLLEIAKRAVEIAIEQDEVTAEKYIQDECLRLGVSLDMTKTTEY